MSTVLSVLRWFLVVSGAVVFAGLFVCLRFSVVTDYVYSAAVKDPERTPPKGNVIVAPADGRVIYVQPVDLGVVPEVVKQGVPVMITEHLKIPKQKKVEHGYLIGISMSPDGVHVNRVPVDGVVEKRIIFNGPHMNMAEAQQRIILTELIPGWVAFKKWLGLPPYAIEDSSDFVTKSARETLVIRDSRDTPVYISRIADYFLGRILTWVGKSQVVHRGDRLGMITWGSQTDICFWDSPGLKLQVEVGDYVYGGETILATY